MTTRKIVSEALRMPFLDRLWVIEYLLLSIRKETVRQTENLSLEEGAKALLSDYTNNKDLTLFTSIVSYKDMPDSDFSPYIAKSYENIDQLWALQLHSKATLFNDKSLLVANDRGKNIFFMKYVDISKDLYMLDTQVLKGYTFKDDAGKDIIIHAGTMKLIIGNIPATGLPCTTDASRKLLIDKMIESRALVEANATTKGYVDMSATGVLTWTVI